MLAETGPGADWQLLYRGLCQGPNGVICRAKLPPEGTECKFTYAGVTYVGVITDAHLVVEGIDRPFATFSGASKTITRTNRNGWNDWYVRDEAGGWTLADDWRQLPSATAVLEGTAES